jgi:hypothetical protein
MEHISIRHVPCPYPLHLLEHDDALGMAFATPSSACPSTDVQSNGDVGKASKATAAGRGPRRGRSVSSHYTHTAASDQPNPSSFLDQHDHGTFRSSDTSGKEDSSIRAVALVLLIESVVYRSDLSQSSTNSNTWQHQVDMDSLALHLALADEGSRRWNPEEQGCCGTSHLQASGYHCVLQESTLQIRIHTPEASSESQTDSLLPTSPGSFLSQQKQSSSSSGSSSKQHQTHLQKGFVDVEVTNRHLMGILTKESLALLIQLMAQVSQLDQH